MDAVLLDVQMPKLDGFGVLNILAHRPDTSDIPFVFLTAQTDVATKIRGLELRQ